MNKYIATFNWTVESNCDKQLLRLFLRETCQLSRKALTEIKYNGGLITVNGVEATVRTLLQAGDKVAVSLPAEQASQSLLPEDLPIDIIYEDRHLLVINKEAGMPTIPSREHPSQTLANAVLGYFKQKKVPATFHAVNRLDKDTSGLVIVAKHRFAHDRLSKLQQDGKVKRFYKAFVEGSMQVEEGTINAPIARKKDSIILREVNEEGQRATTHFKVASCYPSFTYVDVELETGRTHQIRVHFSYKGHPLLGDDLYGGSQALIHRQALHCSTLVFEHPFDGVLLSFEQEMPPDMRSLIQ